MQTIIKTNDLTRAEWLKERQKGLGGSDVAAVLGLSPWSTPLAVYNQKVSPEPIEIPDTPKMRAGRMLEDVVAQYYIEETGRKVMRDNKIRYHKEHAFLLANLDRLIVADNDNKGTGILEIKTSSSYGFDNWETNIPVSYYCQIQHYFNVTGYTWGAFAVLANGWDFKIEPVARNDEFIEMMTERLVCFWNENVLKQVPPAPINLDDIKALYPSHTLGKTAEASFTVAEKLKDLKLINKSIQQLTAQKDSLILEIQSEMQDAEALTKDGEILVTWKAPKVSQKLDTRKLESEYHDVYIKCLGTVQGSRRFLIKNNK